MVSRRQKLRKKAMLCSIEVFEVSSHRLPGGDTTHGESYNAADA